MYSILCDGEMVYAPSYSAQDYMVTSAVLDMELNRASTLTFTMPYGSVAYDSIKKLKSVITVYDGTEKIFHGRCIDSTDDWYKSRTIKCEGELGFLNDSILRPYSKTDTSANIFSYYITQHNAAVSADRQFVVGDVSTMASEQIVRESEQYPVTMDELQEKLIENYGGYVLPRYVGNSIYLDYKATSGGNNSQLIKFGSNMLDMSTFINAAEVKTVLIPLGANDSNNQPITIKSVNNNKDYVQSDTAVALFGRIEVCEKWEDVNTPSILLQRANARISELISEATTLTIKAVDLSLIDVDTERLKLGEYNRVVSAPHDLDAYFQCTKISIDMANPSRNVYTFGNPKTTLTKMVQMLRGYRAQLKH